MKTKDGITVVPGGQLKKSYEEYDDVKELTEEFYDDEEDFDIEESYEEYLSNEIQFFERVYNSKSEKSLTFINDYIDRIKNNDYVILSPDYYVLDFLNHGLKDVDDIYMSYNGAIEKKQIVSDYKKIEPYKWRQ